MNSGDKNFIGGNGADLTTGVIGMLVDGEDPKKDAAVGAGVGVAGLGAVALATGAVVTAPVVIFALVAGSIIGWGKGREKKGLD